MSNEIPQHYVLDAETGVFFAILTSPVQGEVVPKPEPKSE